MSPSIAAVVMAGGLGTRMKSSVPKHLHPLLGRRVVDWVLDAAREAGAILSMEPDQPLPYGRIIRGDDGGVEAIVEERDATPEQRSIRELNTSIYVFDS